MICQTWTCRFVALQKSTRFVTERLLARIPLDVGLLSLSNFSAGLPTTALFLKHITTVFPSKKDAWLCSLRHQKLWICIESAKHILPVRVPLPYIYFTQFTFLLLFSNDICHLPFYLAHGSAFKKEIYSSRLHWMWPLKQSLTVLMTAKLPFQVLALNFWLQPQLLKLWSA